VIPNGPRPEPLHVRGVARPELREDATDPTTLPTDRLELYFVLKSEFKHLLLLFHEVLMSSSGARDSARVMSRAAHRFAKTAEAFADADPNEKEPR
jgi:hypothetical protein